MSEAKRSYRKGKEFIHKTTKQKVIFGRWNTDGTAACLSSDKLFLNLSKDDLDTNYICYTELNQAARDQRRGQCW